MENVNEKEKIQLEASCKHFKMEKILIFLQDFILFFTVGAKDNAHFGCVMYALLSCKIVKISLENHNP